MDEYDVVVVGAGPAGENAAGRCAAGGLSVVLVERELVGGECSYWGCIPSKTLIRPGDVLAATRRVPGAAQAVTGAVDVAAALAQRDYMTSSWSDAGQLPWLADNGIDLVRGHARLDGERAVLVAVPGAPPRRLRARRAVVLATGTRSVLPPVRGWRRRCRGTTAARPAAKDLPRRLVVLGGGAVGVELAQAFRRLGSEQVTCWRSGPGCCCARSRSPATRCAPPSRPTGSSSWSRPPLTGSERPAPDGPVTVLLADGASHVGDELLVAAGRRPTTEDLGLETVGLEPGHPVEVETQLRATGVPGGWLLAVGDVNGLAPLTHMGKYQARIAVTSSSARTSATGPAATSCRG